MRKLQCIIVAICLCFALTSCSRGIVGKAVEQSKLSMANKDYEAALNYLELAKSEGRSNAEVDTMIAIIDNYLKAQNEFEASNIDGANAAINAIPQDYSRYGIASDIEELKAAISKKQAVMSDIDMQIMGTKKLLSAGDYTSVEINITELYSKDLTEYQKIQVGELETTVKSAKSKISEAENKEPQVVYVQQNPPTSSNTNVVATYYVVNCKQSITLRTYPSTSASEITQIPLGQAVGYIENAGNGFYKINYDGRVGYSLAAYLSSTKSSSSTTTRSAQVVNAKEFITLRSSPSTSASEITKIPAGAYVTYLGHSENGFYYIEYSGLRGYGLQSYLQLR